MAADQASAQYRTTERPTRSAEGHPGRTPGRREIGSRGGVGGEIPYRFDASPKWMEGSGWKGQSPAHRKAWPVLRRLLELERWPGAPVRVTHDQLADYLCCSEDTAKRRLHELAGREEAVDLGGVIELKPGSGRRPSIVKIKHPIATPLGYDEVPWAAGGMGEGTPEGYLESLRGPKRRYAELYGVEIPEPRPIPDQDGAPPDEEPPPLPEEELRAEQPEEVPEADPPQTAGPGGAHCTPLETRESCIIRSHPSDARAREARPRPQRDRTDRKASPAQEMEREAAKIPVPEVSEGAVADARTICDALDRRDEITAHRAAQVAELLRRRDRVHLLPEVLGRIRRTVAGGKRIDRPGVYLCTIMLDVERNAIDSEGRELAARVLAHDPPPGDAGGTTGRRSARDRRREGYEWLFED